MRRIIAVLALYLLPAMPVAAAANTFTLYSDACYHVEAGDLLGYRIGIIWLSDDPYVFLQSAGGVWGEPFVAKASAADLKRGKLVFTFSSDGKPIGFRGTISEKMVTGQFDGWRDFKDKPLAVQLKRTSVSQKGGPDCR